MEENRKPNKKLNIMATKKKPTIKEIEEWKKKAEKWDKLGEKIAKYYEGENGEEPEEAGDLCDIGEQACIAYGWM
jgi:hypothetical protein